MAGKYHRGGAKTNVMLALLAVLLVSLGYLSSQKKEGFAEGLCEKGTYPNKCACPAKYVYNSTKDVCISSTNSGYTLPAKKS